MQILLYPGRLVASVTALSNYHPSTIYIVTTQFLTSPVVTWRIYNVTSRSVQPHEVYTTSHKRRCNVMLRFLFIFFFFFFFFFFFLIPSDFKVSFFFFVFFFCFFFYGLNLSCPLVFRRHEMRAVFYECGLSWIVFPTGLPLERWRNCVNAQSHLNRCFSRML